MKWTLGEPMPNEVNTGAYKSRYLLLDGKIVCKYVPWLFGSCGIGAFQGMSMGGYDALTHAFGNKTKVESFINWLKGDGSKSADGWNPQEFLLCITDVQQNTLAALVKHECVKEVDHWVNKAHGPYTMHLYRISLQQEFHGN